LANLKVIEKGRKRIALNLVELWAIEIKELVARQP